MSSGDPGYDGKDLASSLVRRREAGRARRPLPAVPAPRGRRRAGLHQR
ncbi:hypothetical protein AB5I41_09060 [Sphingomonas sp. MMS24-JH45]